MTWSPYRSPPGARLSQAWSSSFQSALPRVLVPLAIRHTGTLRQAFKKNFNPAVRTSSRAGGCHESRSSTGETLRLTRRRFLQPTIQSFLQTQCPKVFGPCWPSAWPKSCGELIERQLPPKNHLRPGQLVWNAVSIQSRPDSPRLQLIPGHPHPDFPLRHRLTDQGIAHVTTSLKMAVARISRDAYQQGALLTMRDIGLFSWRQNSRFSSLRQRWEKNHQTILPSLWQSPRFRFRRVSQSTDRPQSHPGAQRPTSRRLSYMKRTTRFPKRFSATAWSDRFRRAQELRNSVCTTLFPMSSASNNSEQIERAVSDLTIIEGHPAMRLQRWPLLLRDAKLSSAPLGRHRFLLNVHQQTPGTKPPTTKITHQKTLGTTRPLPGRSGCSWLFARARYCQPISSCQPVTNRTFASAIG